MTTSHSSAISQFTFLQHYYTDCECRELIFCNTKISRPMELRNVWNRAVYGIAWTQPWQSTPCIYCVEAVNEEDEHGHIGCCFCFLTYHVTRLTEDEGDWMLTYWFLYKCMFTTESIWRWVGRTRDGLGSIWELLIPALILTVQLMLEGKSEWLGMETYGLGISGVLVTCVLACSCTSSATNILHLG